ncbi:MAG TPA: MEDS domain-containing protein [Usitatibacter sp.]|nr:MEDS domain-containing protein [Usitatibacter sp.]
MRDGDHVCQVYESEPAFLDSLTGFIGHGLWNGEAAVLIATASHVTGVEARLRETGLDLAHLRADDRLITLSPELTLAQFMVDGWPQADRFDAVISQVLVRARGKGRRVRGFGEMVALLWERGEYAATVRLEYLWQKLIEREQVQVLCSYPRKSFDRAPASSRSEITANHTHAIAG